MKEIDTPITVAIIFDPTIESTRLRELLQRCHVWLLGTEPNVSKARLYWSTSQEPTQLSSLTTFIPVPNVESAERCLNLLGTIELHHGSAFSPTPFTTLEVIGPSLTPDIARELRALGFSWITSTTAGFMSKRSPII